MNQSMHRRAFHQLALATAASVAAPAVWSSDKPEKTAIGIAVGGKGSFYYLPLTIAEQLGYFKEEGLDVSISDFAGGAKLMAGQTLAK